MTKVKSKVLKIILIIVSVIVAFSVLIAGINVLAVRNLINKGSSYNAVEIENQLVPVKDENGYWCFVTDGDFKVLHLTDIHIGGGFLSKSEDEMALNAVAAMITKEQPDLVIATGDISYAVPYSAGTFNNYSGAKAFANLMEKLGVYWTVTFGNHDAECFSYYDRQAVSEFYENDEYKYCLYQPGPEDVDGYGNHIIKVKNSAGIITQALIMLDSQAYVNNNIIDVVTWNYDNIHSNQVEWYEAEIIAMNAENEKISNEAGTVKSLAFFHIPLVEMKTAWNEFVENGFENTDNFKYIEGIIGETGNRVYCGTGEDNLFEKMLELGSTKAMFHGHDHYNNTTIEYKGITISYGYTVDYLAYSGIDKQGSQRGCTLITCKPDTTFTVKKFNYYSDRYILDNFSREEVTMQFEDVTYQTEE